MHIADITQADPASGMLADHAKWLPVLLPTSTTTSMWCALHSGKCVLTDQQHYMGCRPFHSNLLHMHLPTVRLHNTPLMGDKRPCRPLLSVQICICMRRALPLASSCQRALSNVTSTMQHIRHNSYDLVNSRE